MIKEALIVEEIRKIRYEISKQFDNDYDKYIDYLQLLKKDNVESNTVVLFDP